MSKGLKLLNKKRTSIPTCECYCTTRETIKQIEKELKVLEIIVEKRLNVDEIYHKDYEWYTLDHKDDDASLIPTKKEYDLLKEVML